MINNIGTNIVNQLGPESHFTDFMLVFWAVSMSLLWHAES